MEVSVVLVVEVVSVLDRLVAAAGAVLMGVPLVRLAGGVLGGR